MFFSQIKLIYTIRKLVPFGEYTMVQFTSKIVGNLDIPLSNLSSGSEETEKISFGKVDIIPMICLKVHFQNLLNLPLT